MIAINIPDNFLVVTFSPKKIAAMRNIEIGPVAAYMEAFEAVVYCKPMVCMPQWSPVPHKLKRKRPSKELTFGRGNPFPLTKSQVKKQREEIINLKVTTVKGGILDRAIFEAINEDAQKKHAPNSAIAATNGVFDKTLLF